MKKQLSPLPFDFEFQGQRWRVELTRYGYRFFRWEHERSLQALVNMMPSIVAEPYTWVPQAVEPSTPNSVSLVHWSAVKAIKDTRKNQILRRKLVVRDGGVSRLCADLLCCTEDWVKILKLKTHLTVARQ